MHDYSSARLIIESYLEIDESEIAIASLSTHYHLQFSKEYFYRFPGIYSPICRKKSHNGKRAS
jgi:hypothetical protein